MNLMLIDISSCIQAAATVVIVILTGLTLLVLLRYADDTKRIADVSASQTEHSQMPFLAVTRRSDGWAIKNQGFGPALNIVFTGYNVGSNKTTNKPTFPLGIGEDKLLPELEQVINHWHEVTVWYESLSGRKYITSFKLTESGYSIDFYKSVPMDDDRTIRDSLKGFVAFLKFWN